MRVCSECGATDAGSGLFPYYRLGRQYYVCFNCLTSHRGALRNLCPPNVR